MSLIAFSLVFVAAFLHAGWNFLLKQVSEKLIVTWWASLLIGFGLAPFTFLLQPMPSLVWPYVVASTLLEIFYFVVLAIAYQHGDFSLVYPIARGSAPAFLACWSLLFMHESPSRAGWGGLALLTAGLAVVGSSALWNQRGQGEISLTGVGAALSIALMISIYSAVDAAAVHLVAPAPYMVLVFALSSVGLAPIMLRRYGWSTLTAIGRFHWQRIGIVAALMFISYVLVLAAYQRAPVSYTGALRECSVVLAALAGWRWLGEGFGPVRAVGAAIIFCGILVIAVAG